MGPIRIPKSYSKTTAGGAIRTGRTTTVTSREGGAEDDQAEGGRATCIKMARRSYGRQ
jgi:hypothetical protein